MRVMDDEKARRAAPGKRRPLAEVLAELPDPVPLGQWSELVDQYPELRQGGTTELWVQGKRVYPPEPAPIEPSTPPSEQKVREMTMEEWVKETEANPDRLKGATFRVLVKGKHPPEPAPTEK